LKGLEEEHPPIPGVGLSRRLGENVSLQDLTPTVGNFRQFSVIPIFVLERLGMAA
jgi:hypothetical protein